MEDAYSEAISNNLITIIEEVYLKMLNLFVILIRLRILVSNWMGLGLLSFHCSILLSELFASVYHFNSIGHLFGARSLQELVDCLSWLNFYLYYTYLRYLQENCMLKTREPSSSTSMWNSNYFMVLVYRSFAEDIQLLEYGWLCKMSVCKLSCIKQLI